MGDLGGLYDALRLIGLTLTSPFSSIGMKVLLLVSLFRPNQNMTAEDQKSTSRTKTAKL